VVRIITFFQLVKNYVKTGIPFLAFWAYVYEIFGHKWKNGALSADCSSYQVVLTIMYKKKPVKSFKVNTCEDRDPFL